MIFSIRMWLSSLLFGTAIGIEVEKAGNNTDWVSRLNPDHPFDPE